MVLSLALLVLLAAMTGTASAQSAPAAHPHVTLDTNKGKIVLELYPDKAPKTVENFLHYVRSGHYDGTQFHRVIQGFMIQGGGFDTTGKEKPSGAPIHNEADNGLRNDRGTVAMARTGEPHSATAQFFISLKDNNFLNYQSKTPQGWGYTVFGKVIQGMDVVDAIAAVPVQRGGLSEAVPTEPVVLRKATVGK
jgi:peptidyl-prolyl cis-trans isomerase B (cyclophilin B)